jgi:hypothetical protein
VAGSVTIDADASLAVILATPAFDPDGNVTGMTALALMG